MAAPTGSTWTQSTLEAAELVESRRVGETGIPRDYLSRLEGGMATLHLNRTLAALRALGVRLEATLDYELDEVDDDG